LEYKFYASLLNEILPHPPCHSTKTPVEVSPIS